MNGEVPTQEPNGFQPETSQKLSDGEGRETAVVSSGSKNEGDTGATGAEASPQSGMEPQIEIKEPNPEPKQEYPERQKEGLEIKEPNPEPKQEQPESQKEGLEIKEPKPEPKQEQPASQNESVEIKEPKPEPKENTDPQTERLPSTSDTDRPIPKENSTVNESVGGTCSGFDGIYRHILCFLHGKPHRL